MKVVEQIKKPIYEEMDLFEEKFTESMSSKVALLNRITHYVKNIIFVVQKVDLHIL